MIASAIISGLGTAASGIMSIINNKRAQQAADAESARQIAYAEAKAAENPLAKAGAQAAMGEYNRKAKQAVDNARSRDKVLGTMDANKVQKGAAEGYAELLSGLGGQADANQEKWSAAAEEARQNKALADQQRYAARNESYAALAANAANAMSGLWADDKKGTNVDSLIGSTNGQQTQKNVASGGSSFAETNAAITATGSAVIPTHKEENPFDVKPIK